jgi:hypothetical protein
MEAWVKAIARNILGMYNLAISLPIVAAVAAALALLFKKKLAETLFPALICIIFILYCFGLINKRGCLLAGLVFIAFLSVGCVFYIAFQVRGKSRNILRQIEFFQGLILLSFFVLLTLFMDAGRYISGWDEFNHWALRVKHMFITDAFVTYLPEGFLSKPMAQVYYPPGTALILYFFGRIFSGYSEDKLLFAQHLLYFLWILPLLKDAFTKGNRLKSLLITIILLTIPVSSFYSLGLYVDDLLGIGFGISLVYHYIYIVKKKDAFGLLIVTSSIFFLSIIKDMGFWFSIGAIICIIIDVILSHTKSNNKATRSNFINLALYITFPILIICFTNISWKILLSANRAQGLKSINLNNLVGIFTNRNLAQWQIETKNYFFYFITHTNFSLFGFSITPVFFFAVFTVISMIAVMMFRRSIFAVRSVVITVMLVIGAVIYHSVLLCVFLFVFGRYEGSTYESYSRYLFSYVQACIIWLLTYFFQEETEQEKFEIAQLKLFALIFCVIALVSRTTHFSKVYDGARQRLLTPSYFQPRPDFVSNIWRPYLYKEKTPLYVIAQGNNGYIPMMITYQLYSEEINTSEIYWGWAWSIGLEPYHGLNDPWTKIWKAEEWENYILKKGYRYLYVFNADEKFNVTYGHFFKNNPVNGMLYEINVSDGQIQMVSVLERN